MKKPVVDKNLCIGCGVCIALCPSSFKWAEDSKAEGIFPPNEAEGSSDDEILETARQSCPTGAITLEDIAD